MSDEELEQLAARFVRKIRIVERTESEPEFNIGLIVAHSAIPSAISAPSIAIVRYGICVSVGALFGQGLAALLSALAIEKHSAWLAGKLSDSSSSMRRLCWTGAGETAATEESGRKRWTLVSQLSGMIII